MVRTPNPESTEGDDPFMNILPPPQTGLAQQPLGLGLFVQSQHARRAHSLGMPRRQIFQRQRIGCAAGLGGLEDAFRHL